MTPAHIRNYLWKELDPNKYEFTWENFEINIKLLFPSVECGAAVIKTKAQEMPDKAWLFKELRIGPQGVFINGKLIQHVENIFRIWVL